MEESGGQRSPDPIISLFRLAYGFNVETHENGISIGLEQISAATIEAVLTKALGLLVQMPGRARDLRHWQSEEWDRYLVTQVGELDEQKRIRGSVRDQLQAQFDQFASRARNWLGAANPIDGLLLATDRYLEMQIINPRSIRTQIGESFKKFTERFEGDPQPWDENPDQWLVDEAFAQLAADAIQSDEMVFVASTPETDGRPKPWMGFLPFRTADGSYVPAAFYPPIPEIGGIGNAQWAQRGIQYEWTDRAAMESLVFFESMRQQVAARTGLRCPFSIAQGTCCRRNEQIERLWRAGELLHEKAGTQFKRWSWSGE